MRSILIFIDRWSWLLLALTAPFLIFPSPSRSLAMLVVPGIWLVGWLARRAPLPRTPLNLSLLILASMVGVGLYATPDLAFSFPKIAGMVLGFGVFFAFARAGQRVVGWWVCLLIYLVAGFALAAFALVSTSWGNKFGFLNALVTRLTPRITGLPGAETGVSSNELAGALLWIIPVFLALASWFFTRRIARRRMLASTLTATMTLFLLGVFALTQSRGAYLGLAIALALILLIALPPRARLVVLLVVIGALALALVVIRPVSSDGASALSLESAMDSWEGRSEVWSRALYAIQDFPFTGMGMNTFRRAVHILYPLFLIGPDVDFAHAHNEFLQAALDLGIPGLIAFIALYLGSFAMLLAIWRRARVMGQGGPYAALALGMGGGLVAHLVYGMTDAIAFGAKPGILFWMLLALIAALYGQIRSGEWARAATWFAGRFASNPAEDFAND